ncbi:UNVERIFIED_CONTAM: hypothetical protein K2H54_010508 [Gekko kuhli]
MRRLRQRPPVESSQVCCTQPTYLTGTLLTVPRRSQVRPSATTHTLSPLRARRASLRTRRQGQGAAAHLSLSLEGSSSWGRTEPPSAVTRPPKGSETQAHLPRCPQLPTAAHGGAPEDWHYSGG